MFSRLRAAKLLTLVCGKIVVLEGVTLKELSLFSASCIDFFDPSIYDVYRFCEFTCHQNHYVICKTLDVDALVGDADQ